MCDLGIITMDLTVHEYGADIDTDVRYRIMSSDRIVIDRWAGDSWESYNDHATADDVIAILPKMFGTWTWAKLVRDARLFTVGFKAGRAH